MWKDEAGNLIDDGAQYMAPDGTVFPQDFPKDEIAGLVRVPDTSPPAPPPPNETEVRASACAMARSSGCSIISAGTPSISGTYAVDDVSVSNMLSEVMSITADGTFIGGGTTEVWPVAGGAVVLTIPQFTDVRKAVSGWVKGWKQYASGISQSPPTSPVDIP